MHQPNTPESPVNQALSGTQARARYIGQFVSGPGIVAEIAYQLASLRMGDIVGAHNFDKRERLILDFVRWYSFGVGRTEAEFPEQAFFVVALRTTKGNVSELINGLKDKLVIEESPAGYYGFVLPWQNWKATLRFNAVEVVRQLELFERPSGLPGALREIFIEGSTAVWPIEHHYGAKEDARQCMHERPGDGPQSDAAPQTGAASFINSKFTNREQERPKSVPESGTEFPKWEPESQFPNREPEKTVGKTGPPSTVPESGTGPALMSSTASTAFKQYCLGKASRGKKFSDAEQARWNRLIGAIARPDQKPFRNALDKNWWIAFNRHNGAELNALLDDLQNVEKVHGKRDYPAAWIRYRWDRRGRPGDWH